MGRGLGGHLQVRVLCERGDNPAPGPSGSEHSAAEAATSGAAVPPQKDPQSTERGRVPTTGSRPKAAQPRHRPHHDEDHHPAGGSAGGATGRQRLLHFPSRRPGDECDPRLVQISKEWHNRLEAGDPALQSPLRTLLLACLIKHLRELMGADGLQSGGDCQAAGGGVVGPSGGVDLLSVEPLGEKAEEARGEGNDLSDGSAREVLSPCQFAWRHRPEIQLEAKALRDGRRRPDNSDFFMSISLRGALSHQAHDCFVQLIGVAALQLIGASLKREVPKRSPLVQQLAEAVFHQGRRPQKWLMHPRLLPSTPPAETAMSTCRSHHCPGLHYALWHVANCTNTLHQLPKALVCLAGRGCPRQTCHTVSAFGVVCGSSAARRSRVH